MLRNLWMGMINGGEEDIVLSHGKFPVALLRVRMKPPTKGAPRGDDVQLFIVGKNRSRKKSELK